MLASDSATRKDQPMAQGLLDYFPDALAAVSHVSVVGARQHNAYKPDGSIMWRKELSTDHADCIIRHLADRGTIDKDGIAHTAKVAWRALALLQIEIEKQREGAVKQGSVLGDFTDYEAAVAADAFELRPIHTIKGHPVHTGVDLAQPGSDRTVFHLYGDEYIPKAEFAKILGVDEDQIIDERELRPKAPGEAPTETFQEWIDRRLGKLPTGQVHDADVVNAEYRKWSSVHPV